MTRAMRRAAYHARLRSPRPRSIALRIDELAFHGFVRGQSVRIADAMQSELTACLTDRGVPAAWGPAARPPSITIRPGAGAREIGHLVAHALMNMRAPR